MVLPIGFELFLLLFLVLGIVFSLIVKSFILKLIVIFLFGVITSTAYRFTGLDFPYTFLSLAFVIGYMIVVGFNLWILVLFLVGLFFGKFLKKWLNKHFYAQN